MENDLQFSQHNFKELSDFISTNGFPPITSACSRNNFIAMISENKKNPLLYHLNKHSAFIPTTGKEIPSQCTSVSLSPCETYVATGHQNGQIVIWHLEKKIALSDINPNTNSVSYLSFQSNSSALNLIAAFSNGEIHKIEISSLFNYLFLKQTLVKKLPQNVTKIICSSSFDNLINLIAILLPAKSVLVLNGDNFDEIASFELQSTNSLIDFRCDKWSFKIAIYNPPNMHVYNLFEDGKKSEINSFVLNSNVSEIGFISNQIIFVVYDDFISIININCGVVARIVDSIERTSPILTNLNSIVFPPFGMVKIESAEEKMRNLINKNMFSEAISFAILVFNGDNNTFYNINNENKMKIQELLYCSFQLLLNDHEINDDNIQLISESVIKCELNDFFFRFFKLLSKNEQLRAVSIMLKTEGIRLETTALILREIGNLELSKNDANEIEDILIKSEFTPTFIQEAIALGQLHHLNRFVLSLCDRYFNDILPVFALMIDSGDSEQISSVVKYLFLTDNTFDKYKTNLCIVWLHTQAFQTYAPNRSRLEKVIKSCWNSAASLVSEFLNRAPIKFSSSQVLKDTEIIKSVLCCFESATFPEAEELFLLIAKVTIDKKILIPPVALPHILKYIFESNLSTIRISNKYEIHSNDYNNSNDSNNSNDNNNSNENIDLDVVANINAKSHNDLKSCHNNSVDAPNVSRSIRELLFMKIVDFDYPEIDLDLFKLHCVKAGFSSVIQRFPFQGEENMRLQVQCRLLSDRPEDAIDLIENHNDDIHVQEAIIAFFKPLLYLDPKRVVRLIANKYPLLHSNQNTLIHDIPEKKLYFETLFSFEGESKIATDNDVKAYLTFLSSSMITLKYLIQFLRENNVYSHEAAFRFCEYNQIFIGCAVISCLKKEFQSSFVWYQRHIANGGIFDKELAVFLLNNINEINEIKPLILLVIFEPLVLQTNDEKLFLSLIKDSVRLKVEKTDILIALYSIYIECSGSYINNENRIYPLKSFLEDYIKNSGFIIKLDDSSNLNGFKDIIKLVPKENCQYSNGKLILEKFSTGAIVISTILPNESCEKMSENLSEAAMYLMQRSEVLLMNKKDDVLPEVESTIIITL